MHSVIFTSGHLGTTDKVGRPMPVGAKCALEVARSKAAGSEGSDGVLARSVFEEFFGLQPALLHARESTEPLHACGYGPAILEANCPPATGHDAALQDVLDILSSSLSDTVAASSRPQGLSASELTRSRSNDCRPASLQSQVRTMAPLPRHHVAACQTNQRQTNHAPISGMLTQTQTQTRATRKALAQNYWGERSSLAFF